VFFSVAGITGHKTSMQNLAAFLDTNNEQLEKEIRKTIPGINLTKEGNDPCNKNYKTMKKEIKEDPRRWKGLCLPIL
jgi:hypothetical protein